MKQLTEDDLKTMTPEAIVEAQDQGRCNALLGLPVIPATGQLTQTHLDAMKKMHGGHELINQALEQGRFNTLLGTPEDAAFKGRKLGSQQ